MPLLMQFYSSKQSALDAVKELKRRGLRDEAVHIADTLDSRGEAGLVRRGVRQENASNYAARVRAGQTLLIVDAPFRGVAIAQAILDRQSPQPAATAPQSEGEGVQKPQEHGSLSRAHYEGGAWDNATPLSSALGIPVLSLHNPAALSSLFGLPVLTRGQGSKTKLLSSNFFFGKIFGPLLTKKGEPTNFGLPLLTKTGAPTNFGLPLLIKGGKPLSFGLPLLARDK